MVICHFGLIVRLLHFNGPLNLVLSVFFFEPGHPEDILPCLLISVKLEFELSSTDLVQLAHHRAALDSRDVISRQEGIILSK